MNNIKKILSIGLTIILFIIFPAANAKDSTGIAPPTTTPAGWIVWDKGSAGPLLAYGAWLSPSPITATFTALNTGRPKCPTGYTPKVSVALKGNAYPDASGKTFRVYQLGCGEPNTSTYVVTCTDAVVYFGEGYTAPVYISWTLMCTV